MRLDLAHGFCKSEAAVYFRQALQKIKASPNFARDASVAHKEYQAQARDAERAVQAFCELRGLAERLDWRHRPDLKMVCSNDQSHHAFKTH